MKIVLTIILLLVAGLSTLIGTLIVVFNKIQNKKILGFILGISSGMMLGIALFDLMYEGISLIISNNGIKISILLLILFVLIGFIIALCLDKFLHHHHEEESDDCKLCNVGIKTSIMTALHKLPEGLAIFVSIYSNPLVGISLALSIAIHHIPEGIMISAPIYYATKSKKKAFKYSLLSGLALPISGIIGFFILKPLLTIQIEAAIFIITASILIYIAVSEIIPTSKHYLNNRNVILAIILGLYIIFITTLI